MIVSVLQENLARGLGIVSRAVSPRSTLPVLANVLVATDEGRLRLSATNLELGITCWIGAKVEEEGATTVPARTFTDLVNTLTDDRVDMELTVRTQTLNVRTGTSNTDIKCIDAQGGKCRLDEAHARHESHLQAFLLRRRDDFLHRRLSYQGMAGHSVDDALWAPRKPQHLPRDGGVHSCEVLRLLVVRIERVNRGSAR